MIRFACTCGKVYVVDDGLAGRKARCAVCKVKFLIPMAPAEPAEEARASTEAQQAAEPGEGQAPSALAHKAIVLGHTFSVWLSVAFAGIMIIGGLISMIQAPRQSWSPEYREIHRSLLLVMVAIAAPALLVRAFLPRYSLFRGLLVFIGVWFVFFPVVLMLHWGMPKRMEIVYLIPMGIALVGWSLKPVLDARRDEARIWDAQGHVRMLQQSGKEADVCPDCGGCGRAGAIYRRRCKTCGGEGYLVTS